MKKELQKSVKILLEFVGEYSDIHVSPLDLEAQHSDSSGTTSVNTPDSVKTLKSLGFILNLD